MKTVWKKPVLTCYKERNKQPERKAFAVIKTRELSFSKTEQKGAEIDGSIVDFFPLMGDIDYFLSKEGSVDKYVLCWFDDDEDDFIKGFRRLSGVTFPAGVKVEVDKNGKKTYNAAFRSEYGKIE